MNYQETCDYLYNQIPMFERQGASGYKEGLSNTHALDAHFGHPHRYFQTIHVGGTNGKGSCSHTLAAILQQSGLRVGLYTSPHLVDFRERIRINGTPIGEEYVTRFVETERSFFEPLHPSFFEVTTAMAFKYFKDMNVDIAVVEVGLGGRLDCTNIITPLVSIITNISYDHTQFLGNTLAKIAGEKAGIIKPDVPVVIGENHDETRPVFEQKAAEVHAPIIFAEDLPEVLQANMTSEGGMRYVTRSWGNLDGDLGGLYQQKNMNTVLHAIKCLNSRLAAFEQNSPFQQQNPALPQLPVITLQHIREGIAHVASQTGLMGRWQVVDRQPLVVCDTGHNVGGWQYLSRQLAKVNCRKMHIVFGMVSDKDIDTVLTLLPKDAIYYFTKAESHRAVSELTILEKAKLQNLTGGSYPSVYKAYIAARAAAKKDDCIFVGGSSYVVGDFLKTCF